MVAGESIPAACDSIYVLSTSWGNAGPNVL